MTAPGAPPYHPAWWLPGGHLQTLGGKYMRPRVELPLRRERWDTPDGDFLDLDFGPDPDEGAPLVLLLHGLEGFAKRPYMLHAMGVLASRGIASVGLNFRGCSGEPNRLARMYHSGDTKDTGLVLRALRERWPRRPLGALGFSLGGNVLLKLLGEGSDADGHPVEAAAAISVPYDLSAGVAYLEGSPVGRFYARYFLTSLTEKVKAKEKILAPLLDLEAVYASRNLSQFDDAATAPLHGFEDAQDYYRQSSSSQFLEGIRVPTFLVHARDDPFLPSRAIPVDFMRRNPAIEPLILDRGGHVGFLAGPVPGRPRFWAEDRLAEFLAYHLG
jgi:predicted alpha/beta-fold hydrolase